MGGVRSLLGPLRAVLGCPWGLCWLSGGSLGTYVGDLGPLFGLYARSWAALGASIDGPKEVQNMGTSKRCLFLEREDDLRPWGRSWHALGACLGDFGPLLGLM